jgi:hypothetical protein
VEEHQTFAAFGRFPPNVAKRCARGDAAGRKDLMRLRIFGSGKVAGSNHDDQLCRQCECRSDSTMRKASSGSADATNAITLLPRIHDLPQDILNS